MKNKYLKEYEWADIREMKRNNKKDPKECIEDFNNRWVLITGATHGIGYSTARKYASHGSNLLLINRNESKSIEICEEIRKDFGVQCDYKIADFSRISDIHNVGKELVNSEIDFDVIIHNAGVYSTKKLFTDDGNELVFQVNYLASFILNYMLTEKLKAHNKARILLVNSEGHRFAISGIHLEDLKWDKHRYSGLKGYGSAKTAQLLSMMKFVDVFEGTNVTMNAMHPGNVKSNMGENNGKIYRFYKHKFINRSARSPEISATSLYYLGVSEEINGITGKFFNLTTEEKPAPHALDKSLVDELWDISIKLGGLE